MIGKLDEAFQFQQTALRVRAERQQVLASNIANADTPNYKARDMDFNSALKQALAGGVQAASPLATTSPAHLAGTAAGTTPSGAPLLYRTVRQGSVDGNTVDMDMERNQFTDNALRYEAGVTFVSTQLKNLLAALQGQ
ncbi:flagellar basal body rod protein FlgB [Noviherbaspirillum sp.]|uniref:flagellar basal body rod protein FlgB n=1 Tax=Noviherbaspirillum sp. TaxID=1926288 RepID=UPI002B477962|nr:flagellar basal body rod protein FlgB [Noviherbaspirillum sp.]HJV79585.1 flagellar basal body rod protein FlgB [Noviherbaspirillum sp.]